MLDETSVRREITELMVMAGVMALVSWKERRRLDPSTSEADLVSDIFVAMRRKQSQSNAN